MWYLMYLRRFREFHNLLRSSQQGQVGVGHEVGQAAPLAHAQRGGSLHMALHGPQVLLPGLADIQESTIKIHLPNWK